MNILALTSLVSFLVSVMLVQLSATAYARESANEKNPYPAVFVESVKLDFHVYKPKRDFNSR